MRLIDGEPFIYIRIVARDYEFRIIEEVVYDSAVGPGAVFVEEGERGIPVEECDCGVYAVGVHLGDDVVVVLYSFFVHRAVAEGEEAWP